jgi:hypothetical protein
MDDATPPWDDAPAAPSKIPHAWRAMGVLAEAVAVLEANPDLFGDDILLAVESEAPEATGMIDAIILAIRDKKAAGAARKILAARFYTLGKRDEYAAVKLCDMLPGFMSQLRLKSYRGLAGMASLVWHQGKAMVTDKDLVPKEFKTTTTETTLDMRAITKKLIAKQPVPGAMLSNGYHSVTIRG